MELRLTYYYPDGIFLTLRNLHLATSKTLPIRPSIFANPTSRSPPGYYLASELHDALHSSNRSRLLGIDLPLLDRT